MIPDEPVPAGGHWFADGHCVVCHERETPSPKETIMPRQTAIVLVIGPIERAYQLAGAVAHDSAASAMVRVIELAPGFKASALAAELKSWRATPAPHPVLILSAPRLTPRVIDAYGLATHGLGLGDDEGILPGPEEGEKTATPRK